MVQIEKHRVRAFLVALEHIDRNLNEYEDKEEQDDALADLIIEHDLQEFHKPRDPRKRAKVIPLTVERYRGDLGRLASTRKRDDLKKAGIHDLFEKGSSIIDPKFLERVKREASSDSDGEDEDDPDDPEAEHQQADSRPSATVTTSSEVPNSVDESSQGTEIDTTNGNVLPVPEGSTASQMSVRNDQVADSKKRKHDDSDGGIALPIITKRKAPAAQVDVDLTVVRTT